MNIDEIKKEYFKKLEELNNASTENKEITEFGYRYFDANCSEIYKIADFANIYTWIENVLKKQESQIKQSILKAIMEELEKEQENMSDRDFDWGMNRAKKIVREVLNTKPII